MRHGRIRGLAPGLMKVYTGYRHKCENENGMLRGCLQSARLALLAASLANSAWAAAWTEYSAGPFRVVSDAGGRPPKLRLAELDQLRHTLGAYLGKDDLDLVWPIELVLFANQREYTPQAPPQLLTEGPVVTVGAWMADTALPHDLLRAITRQLIDDNAQRMPPAIEQGLVDLMATVQINNKDNRVSLGAPPAAGELPPERMRAWAKLQMLATQAEFSGKLRVYLNNLQQGGDEELAAKNAFGISLAELNQRAGQYYEAGKFAALPASGPPINPDRDFDDRKLSDSDLKDLLATLKKDSKEQGDSQDFPPDSPRGLGRQRTKDALEQAVKANPRWAEPHDKLAALLGDPAAKVKELKLATSLEPRNSDYWQDLAVAEEDVFQYGEADKAWKMAERNATADIDKARLHKERLALNDRQAQASIEERKAKITNDNDDLERVKKAAEARLHAAEDAANKRAGALTPGVPVVAWWSDMDGEKLSGSLTNVECLKDDVLRLTVQSPTSPAVKLLIPDLHRLAVKGAEKANFACGLQKPPKAINLVHDGKADAQQGTVGNIRTVELP